MSEPIGGLPKTIHLYIRSISETQYPIGKIDTFGGLSNKKISFKITKNSDNPNFPDDLVGNCLKGIIDEEGNCELVAISNGNTIQSVANKNFPSLNTNINFEGYDITIEKRNNEDYLQVYVNNKATFMYVGDNIDPNNSMTGDSEV